MRTLQPHYQSALSHPRRLCDGAEVRCFDIGGYGSSVLYRMTFCASLFGVGKTALRIANSSRIDASWDDDPSESNTKFQYPHTQLLYPDAIKPAEVWWMDFDRLRMSFHRRTRNSSRILDRSGGSESYECTTCHRVTYDSFSSLPDAWPATARGDQQDRLERRRGH